MKENTIQNIRDTFLKILADTPIDKVTVTQICKSTDINRGTFYRYYQDVYAVLEDIEESMLSQFFEYTTFLINAKVPNQEVLILFLELIKQNKSTLNAIYNNTNYNYNHFSETFSNAIREPIYRIFKEHVKPEYANELPYVYNYCLAGSSGIIFTWIRGGFKESTREIADIIQMVSKNGLVFFLI